MKKNVLTIFVFSLILGACASKTPDLNKSDETLEEFIEKIPSNAAPNISAVILAKSVKKVPGNGDIFIQMNNLKKIEVAFDGWCKNQSIDYNSEYKYGFRNFQKDIMSAAGIYQNKTVPINACFSKNTQSLIAGYAVLKDGMIAFYGPKEASDIRSANLILEESEKRNAAIFAEARKKEYERQAKCRMDLSSEIRKNIAVGVQTNQGMVVDVKNPLVQVQKYRGEVPVLEWVKLTMIGAPDMINYCR